MKALAVLLLTAALLALLADAHAARNVTARRRNPTVGKRQGEPDDDFVGPSDPNYEVVTKAPDDLSGPAPLPTDLNCVCVPYYQCDSNQNVNQDGEGIIDIRLKEGACEHYLDYCCNLKDGNVDPPAPTGPTQPSQPSQPEPTYPSYPEPEQPSNPPTQRPPRPQQPQQPDKEFHPTPPPQQMQCGVRNPEGVGFRITGAEDGEAQFGEFPWMVAILQQERIDDNAKPLNLYQCGGALIHPQVVLTGAHCVAGKQPNLLKIRAGEWDTQTTKEVYAHQDRGVASIIVHPQFNPRSLHNDIALLILLDPVQVGGHIGVICLPEQDQQFDYKRCFASGWGKNKFEQDGQYQVILKKLDLPIVPHAECQELLRKTRLGAYFLLDASFICAGGEPGRDTCRGDGGSPLVCPIENEPNRYYHAGIVAWGIDCGLPNVPAVYGSVAYFRNWVDNELSKLNVDTSGYRV